MSEELKYSKFSKSDGVYYPVSRETLEIDRLPPGVYTLGSDMKKGIFFNPSKVTHDKLLDLPGTEYDIVMDEIDVFLKEETKAACKKYGCLYKRGIFLHGVPGTGKTSIVNRIVQKVVAKKGIVLFNPHPGYLSMFFEALDSVQPETLVMVIFEEFEKTIAEHEQDLLSLLDGQVQKNNVIYAATTNFLGLIPPRILRPGRFPTQLEVKFPGSEARQYYFKSKLESEKDVKTYVEKTEGLSMDDLKEVIFTTKCLGQDLDTVTDRLKEFRKNTKNYTQVEMINFDVDDLEEMMEIDGHGN